MDIVDNYKPINKVLLLLKTELRISIDPCADRNVKNFDNNTFFDFFVRVLLIDCKKC